MIILRIINVIVIGFYIFLFYRFEKYDKPDSLFLIGVLVLIQYVLQRLISQLIYRKDSINIKITTPHLMRLIWGVMGLGGLVIIINYKFTYISIDNDIAVFLFCIGLIIFFESINRLWSDIVITDKIIGKRYLARFSKWSKISNYDFKKDTIELWTPTNNLKIRLGCINKNEQQRIIELLNQKLNNKLNGKLIFENNELIVKE